MKKELAAFFVLLLLVSCAQKLDMIIKSPAFDNNAKIPVKFTCNGIGVNPELDISGIPAGTKTLALIVEDPDAPHGTFVHWVVWNIPPGNIAENSVPGIEGVNSANKKGYFPPCPPSGSHRYVFKVYALDVSLDLSPGAAKADLEKAMKWHVLAEGHLIGIYSK